MLSNPNENGIWMQEPSLDLDLVSVGQLVSMQHSDRSLFFALPLYVVLTASSIVTGQSTFAFSDDKQWEELFLAIAQFNSTSPFSSFFFHVCVCVCMRRNLQLP